MFIFDEDVLELIRQEHTGIFDVSLRRHPTNRNAMSRLGVEVGHNPLGTRMAPERYQAVYDLCACSK